MKLTKEYINYLVMKGLVISGAFAFFTATFIAFITIFLMLFVGVSI